MRKSCSIPGCDSKSRTRGWCSMHYQRWCRNGDPLIAKPKSPDGAGHKWISEHKNYDGDDCVSWPFGGYGNGYGAICVNGANRVASNYMCEVAHGPCPDDKPEAAHSCGNGHLGCMNPKHLRWASRTENKADELFHGRRNRGERQGHSRLTNEQVLSIDRELRSGRTSGSIAREIGVSDGAVNAIRTGYSWSWLTGRFGSGDESLPF